jgi:tetratricopeptide (TPR) repeat protein/DNA-binding MarR family transcriptional regulator
MPDPPTRDLVVLHLDGYGRFQERTPVPTAVSTPGIRAVVAGERDGVADRVALLSTLEDLEREGLIEGRVAPVEDGHRRNVYFLTEDGRVVAEEVRERWRGVEVAVPAASAEAVTVERATQYVEDGSLVSVLANVDDGRLGGCDDDEWAVPVGRDAELATVEAALSRVPEEGSRTLLLSGAAGSGKSTLLSRLAAAADDADFEVAIGAARREGDDPYAAVRDAFTGVESAVVDRLMGERRPDIESGGDVEVQRTALFSDVRDAVRESATDRPLVVGIDDLQWADEASLDLFAYLAQTVTEWIYPVLFAASYRPEAVAGDTTAGAAVERLQDRAATTTVELSALESHHVHTLLRDLLGPHEAPEAFVERLRSITGGNPLFVVESVRYLQAEGRLDPETDTYPTDLSAFDPPAAVERAIRHRLDRLDEAGRRVVDAAAVVGDAVRWDLLAAATSLPDPDLRDYVDLLVESRLLERTAEDRLGFRGEFVRDTVLAALDDDRRRRLHAAVAGAIPTAYDDDAGDRYGRLAHHYERAGDPARALAYFDRAAEQATAVYAVDAARDSYRQAVDVAEDLGWGATAVDLHERLARLNRHVAAFDDAEACLDAAAERTDDPAARARIANQRCLLYTHRGAYDEAIERADHGLSVAGDGPSPHRCRLVGQRGWVRMVRGDLDAAREDFETERELATELGDPSLIGDAHHHLGSVDLVAGAFEAGIEHMQRAVEERAATDDDRGLSASLNNLSALYWKAGDLTAARECVERALALTRERNDRATAARTTVNLGLYVEKSGDWERATEHYRESLETVTELGVRQTEAVARENLGSVHLRGGDLTAAREELERALAIDRDIDHTRQAAMVRDRLAALAAVVDDPERARDHASEALELAEACGDAEREAEARARLGDLDRRAGAVEAALSAHRAGRDLADDAGAVETLVHNESSLALDHAAADRGEAGLDHADAAADVAKNAGNPWLRIQALLARGRCLHAAGRFEAAVAPLETATRRSRDLGAALTECRGTLALAEAAAARGDAVAARAHRRRGRELAAECGFERLRRRLGDLAVAEPGG